MTSLAIRLAELDDGQLEEFIEIWVERREKAYVQVLRIGGAHDKGRDVIGFLTRDLHEGDWHLFQCKRKTLGAKLGKPEALVELAKVFFHHVNGSYDTLPTQVALVSPRGVVGPLLDLLTHSSRLKQTLIDEWDSVCAGKITAGQTVVITPAIRAAIDGYDFTRVTQLTATMIVKDPTAKASLVQILNELPGEAPSGVAPAKPKAIEREYLDQLRTVYAEAAGSTFQDVDAVFLDAEYGDHLRDQRTRYFEAEAFKRFHRDNTDRRLVGQFQDDIYQGVVDVHRETHPRLIDRLGAVMKHASGMDASILGRSARIPVKQGVCHHLANEGRLKWTR